MRQNNTQPTFPVAVEAATAIVSFDSGDCIPGERTIPTEEPINILYGGIPFAVMMASPVDLEDFATGFSFTEGVIEKADDIRSIRVEREERGIRLLVDLSAERLHAHLARKRALAGRTGCGLCGIDDLGSLPKARPPADSAPTLALHAIRRALNTLEGNQPLNESTRAVHAAAWSDLDGNIQFVREDVGRHNALDKLIGILCRSGTPPSEGFCLVTSRCSFELVEKVAAFGARTLVAISAPTSLALERARLHDMTLIAIARHDTMTVFHGLERIDAQDGFS
jgi:FdhD protein